MFAVAAIGMTSDFRAPASASSASTSSARPAQAVAANHIALGGPGEMVITTGRLTRPSAVTYWPNTFSMMPGTDEDVIVTTNGTCDAHSQIMSWAHETVDPSIGAVALNESGILALQNTGWWAGSMSLFPYGRGSSYKARTSYKHGIGSYKNPAEIYNSPIVCTTTIKPLLPGTAYSYSVAGSTEVYSFTMPPSASDPSVGSVPLYPYNFGLIADIGQTEVSLANMRFLRSNLAGVV